MKTRRSAATATALAEFAAKAQSRRGSSTTHAAWVSDGRFVCDAASFRVVRMKGDGRCGYHTMHHFAPRSLPWETALRLEGAATHGAFHAFADATGMVVRIHEFHDVSDVPDWAAAAGIPSDCLHKVGTCRMTALRPRRGARGGGECDVLFRHSHYDALRP